MTSQRSPQRLSGLDASFLYIERPNLPQHVGAVGIYEGRISRDDMIRVLEQRMHLIPRYRQRLTFPPFGVAHPVWEDDPSFSVARHMREVTLPSPGDERVLCAVAGKEFAPLLDRSRPLWETVLMHGYRGGDHTAVLSKVHHCMIDGISGVDLTMVLHDITPDAEPPPPPATPWQPAPPADPLTLLQDAVRDQLSDAARRWAEGTFERFRPQEAAERARQLMRAMSSMASMWRPAPPTPFNGPLSPERTTAWVDFSFTEVRAIRTALGGTVNDVVLTLIAGGLGRYLRAHGYRTEGVELRANCPVSLRRPDERGMLGNRFSLIITPLYVGVLDPVARLRLQRQAMDRIKAEDQAGSLYALTQMSSNTPPPLATPPWQPLAGGFDLPNTLYNTVCSNVPGPQIPLYLNGHRLLGGPGFGNLTAGIGLFNGIGSYDQLLGISAAVDPKLFPDPWFYIDCLKESYEELRAAALAGAVAA